MDTTELLRALRAAAVVSDVDHAVEEFQAANQMIWTPVGRENNRGTIELSSDPARANIERVTNGIDSVIELEHERHNGIPDCRTPKDAAVAWLGVPEVGLSGMSLAQRRSLAQRVTVILDPGEGKESRVLEVRDRGIGISPQSIPRTILSLNESNKLSKHYLAGAYGQGGSSTFAFSRYTLIASRYGSGELGFTLVKFLDLPAEEFKMGHYVYFVLEDLTIPVASLTTEEFPSGTQVRHFGYDLNSYGSPVGPNSLYGSMNTNLFDPVMPIWFDNRVHNYRRVIKGSRNALNGAVDEGDEQSNRELAHSVPMFNVSLGDFGRIGIEYWVLRQPTKENKRPSAAFVNPTKPIVLTLNGQNQGELSHTLVRKDAELPFLTQRLIAHIDCNNLSPTSKRLLFVSNRETQREVKVREMIQQEVVKALRSDDVLTKLNEEARKSGMHEQDETAMQQMRSEVSRLLKVHGISLATPVGGDPSSAGDGRSRPVRPPHPRKPLEPIELHEPPTFIRFAGDEDQEFSFYPEQRRYLRIETDANSTYHCSDPRQSSVNIIVGAHLALAGSTPLQSGRMRAIVEALNTCKPGESGTIRLELKRVGMPVLVAERAYKVVPTPEAKPADRQVSMPPFKPIPVGPDDSLWMQLGWSDNVNIVASDAQMQDGTLMVYYSTAFPKFAAQKSSLEQRDVALAESFVRRYEIWMIVHSLLHYQDEQSAVAARATAELQSEGRQVDPQTDEKREQEERCRMAIMSALFSAREVQLDIPRAAGAEV